MVQNIRCRCCSQVRLADPADPPIKMWQAGRRIYGSPLPNGKRHKIILFMKLRAIFRRSSAARYLYARSFALRYWAASRAGHSFAQAGEDLILENLLHRVSFFIDIGAHDGISGSNTFYFALRGARGICFEPVHWTFQKLQSLYALNWRVKCWNVAISDRSGVGEIVSADFLSYISDTMDQGHLRAHPPLETKAETIQLLTFSEALAGLNVPQTIDLLSIDVEGHELNVLRSIPFDQYRFRAIVLETHLEENGNLKWRHRDLDAIELLLSAAGYHPSSSTWVNSIYLSDRPLPDSRTEP
jgi:FkbM family methyltransferase